MIDLAMDTGGLKDSENALNSFFPKINRTVFWRLGTDVFTALCQLAWKGIVWKIFFANCKLHRSIIISYGPEPKLKHYLIEELWSVFYIPPSVKQCLRLREKRISYFLKTKTDAVSPKNSCHRIKTLRFDVRLWEYSLSCPCVHCITSACMKRHCVKNILRKLQIASVHQWART